MRWGGVGAGRCDMPWRRPQPLLCACMCTCVCVRPAVGVCPMEPCAPCCHYACVPVYPVYHLCVCVCVCVCVSVCCCYV